MNSHIFVLYFWIIGIYNVTDTCASDVTGVTIDENANILSTYKRRVRRLADMDDCQPLERQEGIFESTFTLIASLNIISDNIEYFGYKNNSFDYSISSGTLIAQQRNELIFPWDSDGDLYILFENNLRKNEHEKFKYDIINVICFVKYLSNINFNITSFILKNNNFTQLKNIKNFPLPVSLNNITAAENKNCTYGAIGWNVDFPKYLKKENRTLNKYHLLHVRTSKGGWVDLFLLYKNKNKTMIRNDHCCVGNLLYWQNISLFFPSNKLAKWKIYENINVRIPRQTNKILTMEYGNWKIPNVDKKRQSCPNFNKTQIHYLLNKKYKTVIDIVKSDSQLPKIINFSEYYDTSDEELRKNYANCMFLWGNSNICNKLNIERYHKEL